MRTLALTLSFCLLLCGCMKAQDTSTTALDGMEKETSSTWHKLRETLDLGSKPVKHSQPAQARYCYRTFEDVVCYSKPLVGQESRLLAYQDKGAVGYVIEPPPAPLKLRKPAAPTPVVEKPKEADTIAKTPDDKAAADKAFDKPADKPSIAKPAEKPAEKTAEKKDDMKHLKEIIFDPSELEPKKLVPDKMQ